MAPAGDMERQSNMRKSESDNMTDDELRARSEPKTRRLALSGKRVPLDEPERDPVTKTKILEALQHKSIYLGTVPGKVKAARRAKGRRAKAARRAQR